MNITGFLLHDGCKIGKVYLGCDFVFYIFGHS